MNRILVFIYIITLSVFCQSNVAAQTSESGYTSLTIKLSGTYPKELDIQHGVYSTPLSSYLPFRFDQINDSTYSISKYIVGKSLFAFYLDNNYKITLLSPQANEVLHIHYHTETDYELNYQGNYEEVFNNSQLIESTVRSIMEDDDYTYDHEVHQKKYKTAEEFKTTILSKIEFLSQLYTQDIESSILKDVLVYFVETINYSSFINEYETRIKGHNSNIGLEPEEVISSVPTRNQTYYNDILRPDQFSSSKLLPLPYVALVSVVRDTVLNLPDIKESGFQNYKNRLKEIFGYDFNQENNQFYETLIAVAYMDKLLQGESLSPVQQYEVATFFDNKSFSSFILYQNERSILKREDTTASTYHLPYKQDAEAVWDDILNKYKGKVIVVDVWATWCGPCIEASEKMLKVKEQYADRDDVVFVYMTDETSDYDRWYHYARLYGGEHYYLYKNQSAEIYDAYQITHLPSYLIFNKEGELVEKSLSTFMGNDVLVNWIEKALN